MPWVIFSLIVGEPAPIAPPAANRHNVAVLECFALQPKTRPELGDEQAEPKDMMGAQESDRHLCALKVMLLLSEGDKQAS